MGWRLLGREKANGMPDKLLERFRTGYVPSHWIAGIFSGFRERDQTLTWLEKAIRERSNWLV